MSFWIMALVYIGLALMMARHRPADGRTLGQWLVVVSLLLLGGNSAINATPAASLKRSADVGASLAKTRGDIRLSPLQAGRASRKDGT